MGLFSWLKSIFVKTPIKQTQKVIRKITKTGIKVETEPTIAEPYRLSRIIKPGKLVHSKDPSWKHLVRARTGPGNHITEDHVKEIRRLSDKGWSNAAIALRFYIHPSTVSGIMRGKTRTKVK